MTLYKSYLILMLVLIGLCCSSCTSKQAHQGAMKRGGYQIDRESLFTICKNVVEYNTPMVISSIDDKKGSITTNWQMEEQYKRKIRRRLTVTITAVERAAVETYSLSIMAEKQENYDTLGWEKLDWSYVSNDAVLQNTVLFHINRWYKETIERRELGMEDPVFHKIRVGE